MTFYENIDDVPTVSRTELLEISGAAYAAYLQRTLLNHRIRNEISHNLVVIRLVSIQEEMKSEAYLYRFMETDEAPKSLRGIVTTLYDAWGSRSMLLKSSDTPNTFPVRNIYPITKGSPAVSPRCTPHRPHPSCTS